MNAGETQSECKPKKMRAFLALKTPPEWDAEFAALQQRLKSELRTKSIRWTNPEQIHITLRFLGYIPPDEATQIAALLRSICSAQPPFVLRCSGLGCFPNLRRPRVLWAGLDGDIQSVQQLRSAIVEATRQFGEPPDDREFKPHLTLARIQDLERSTREQLEELLRRGFQIKDDWHVTELLLMQSHLSPQGAKYEVLARCHLGVRAA